MFPLESEVLDSSIEIQSGDDSLYLPTPERMVRRTIQNTSIECLLHGLETVGQVHEAVIKYVCVPLPAVGGNSP